MINHNLTNEEYRELPQLSASLLKGCLSSPKKALTPKPRTKALDQGLKVHEFILEHDKFKSNYVCGLNPDDYPNALTSTDELKALIRGYNTNRLPKLSKTGSRDTLIKSLMDDSPEYLAHVTEISNLSVGDLKGKIDQINQADNRGLLSASGTSADLCKRLHDAGVEFEYWSELVKHHEELTELTVLPYAEYTKYQSMYDSLIEHLDAGRKRGDNVMAWLLHMFRNPDLMEREVSMIGEHNKCRMDLMFEVEGNWYAFDLKSTRDASTDQFSRQAYNLHYDLQAAHYESVSGEVGRELVTFGFIAIEPEAPYAVNIFIPPDAWMDSGRKKRAYATKRLTEWKEKGDNTCYEPKTQTLALPAWAGGEWDEE